MRPVYSILSFPMDVLRDRTKIVDTGLLVTSVTVLSNPTGMDASLAFFEQGDLAPIQQQGMSFRKICTTEGVFLSNPVSGGVLVLAVMLETALMVQGV